LLGERKGMRLQERKDRGKLAVQISTKKKLSFCFFIPFSQQDEEAFPSLRRAEDILGLG